MPGSSVSPIVIALAAGVALGSLAHGEPAPTQRTLTGAWGGEGIRVDGTPNGSRIQVDCQLASTDEAIPLDSAGKFAITVTFAPLQGAPMEEVEDRPTSRLTGRVENDVLHLTISSKGAEVNGTFTLERDAKAKLPRCRFRS